MVREKLGVGGVLVAVVWLLWWAGAANAQTSLETNGSFDGSFAPWAGIKGQGAAVVGAPEFLSLDTDTAGGSGNSLRVTLSKHAGYDYYNHVAGASCPLRTPVPTGTTLQVAFYAKRVSGASLLSVLRRGGGGEALIRLPLTDRWERYQVKLPLNYESQDVLFSLVSVDAGNAQAMADGVFLLDDVSVTIAPTHPRSILFASPRGVGLGYINYDYLNHLKSAGFEVDFTESLSEVTLERLRRYHAVVLYMTPETARYLEGLPTTDAENAAYVDAVKRFVAFGGGVFLFPYEQNQFKPALADFTEPWGAKLMLERIVDSSEGNKGNLTYASYPVSLLHTDRVYGTDVSSPGMELWYPNGATLHGAMGGSVVVDGNWTVVASASSSAATVPIDPSTLGAIKPVPTYVRPSVQSPDLMAIRSFTAGRAAIVNQWPQYTIGSGTQYFFHNQVLSEGVGGRPSSWGAIIANTLQWLTQRASDVGGVGGYVTPAGRLQSPNLGEATRLEYTQRPTWEALKATWMAPPTYAPVLRGLIGAKTSYTSGSSDVARYAEAARAAGFSFVVFAEDFDQLSPQELVDLIADCRLSSGDDLLLLPGYSIRTDAGNHAFVYGENIPYPPAEALNGTELKLSEGSANPYMLSFMPGRDGGNTRNLGFYNFSGSGPGAMKASDLRNYGAIALRYYVNGQQREDIASLTSGYLLSAEIGSASAVPVSFNEVRSAAELATQASNGSALTYVRADTPLKALREGLAWVTYAQASAAFVSDGPQIHAWAGHQRQATYGGEDFVTTRAVYPSPLEISAENGLAGFEIYDGRELFWRESLSGQQYSTTLMLDRSVQKSLVLIVTDQLGKKAISHARINWKEGADGAIFCTDRANDCKPGMLLARGPAGVPVQKVLAVPHSRAGATWDGAPSATIPTIHGIEGRPSLVSNLGSESAATFNQTPLLDFSDEGATGVSSEQNQLFAPGVAVINPWATFGPLGGATRLFSAVLRYRELLPPQRAVPTEGWVAYPERNGPIANLFRAEITFKANMTVSELQIADIALSANPTIEHLAYRQYSSGGMNDLNLSATANNNQVIRLAVGDWFAIYGETPSTSAIFIVRERPIRLVVAPGHVYVQADPADTAAVTANMVRSWELFSLGIPMPLEAGDIVIDGPQAANTRVDYLRSPQYLTTQTAPVSSPGLLEVAANQYVARVRVGRPQPANGLTLPLRVTGLNPNWTAGVFQVEGYTLGLSHASGAGLYRETGIAREGAPGRGSAYVPLHVNAAPATEVVVGHPITADARGESLIIRVTRLYDGERICIALAHQREQPNHSPNQHYVDWAHEHAPWVGLRIAAAPTRPR